MKNTNSHKAWLLGIGLDTNDGHKRLTKGENFVLVGGSEDTHGQMTEGVIKLNEKLQKSGKTLEEIDRQHILHVLEQSGWRIRGQHGAAEILGLKPTTLSSKMQKLGIKR